MRRIWGQIKNEQPSFLPNLQTFFDFVGSMYSSIVKNDYGWFIDFQGEFIEFLPNKLAIDSALASVEKQPVVAGEQTPNIERFAFLCRNLYLFVFKDPTVRHVTRFCDLALIAIEKIDLTCLALFLQQAEHFTAHFVGLLVWFPFGPQSNALESALKFFKKRLSVLRLNFRSKSASKSSLALESLWRSSVTRRRTAASSRTLSSFCFRP